MALSKNQIQEIENCSWDLLIEVYNDKEIIPPIDINFVVDKIGLKLKFGFFKNENIDGAYDKVNRTIYVKKDAPYVRQVFTVAHEIGHYCLHKEIPLETFYRNDLNDTSLKNEEQEANWFASSLLMPNSLVRSIWSITKDINEIATRFSVSSTMAYYRLKNLGYIDYE